MGLEKLQRHVNSRMLRRFSCQIHVSRAAGRGYSYFQLYMCVCIYVVICVTPPGQTKNDTHLTFGTHPPIDLI